MQMHVDHVNNIMATLQLDSKEQLLEPGVHAQNTRLFFPQLTPVQVLLLAAQHGTKPRFRIQFISWYRGADDVRFSRAFDGFIKKEYWNKWAPFMFMSVLSILWSIRDVMTREWCVRISVLGPTKVQISLTDQGLKILKTKYRETSHAIGISFKVSATGQFQTADETTRPTIHNDWKASEVPRAYILDVAPYRSIEDRQGTVKGTSPARHILERLSWSVGEMCTAMWRITAEGTTEFVGIVFHTDGLTPLLVICEAEYNARKDLRLQITGSTPRKAFIKASEMSHAMDLDTEVRAKLNILKQAPSFLNDGPPPNGEPS